MESILYFTFENAVVFTSDTPAVSLVEVNPSELSVSAGQDVQLNAKVTTTGFANKAVQWSVEEDNETDPDKKATVDLNGKVHIPSGHSANNPEGTAGVYTVTVETALAEGDSVVIAGKTYNYDAGATTATAQATQIQSLFTSDTIYSVTRSSAILTFTEKTGKYGTGAPVVDDSDLTTGVVEVDIDTPGQAPSDLVIRATSVFDDTKYGEASITVL